MLYIIEYGQPCQGYGCPQMTSDKSREIIPFIDCVTYDGYKHIKIKCNCCYDCSIECHTMNEPDEFGD